MEYQHEEPNMTKAIPYSEAHPGSTILKVIICTSDSTVMEEFVVAGHGTDIELSRAIRDHIGFKFNEADTEADLYQDEEYEHANREVMQQN
jgi:hypothetical protein